MPDLEGALPLILLMIFLWVRSIGAAMKRNRQRQEQALEQAGEAPEFEVEPSPVEAVGAAGGEAPPPARRPTLREQLRDMGRQLEQQMQQAAEEGRPGSMVGHVDPEEAPEVPGMLRPTASREPARPPPPLFDPAASAPATAPAARTRPASGLSPRVASESPASRSPSQRSGGAQPLERFERYAPLPRAVILSEILGRPPGLSD